MSTDDLRAKLRDELSGFPIGTGYYQTTVGTNEAREMADALLPIIDAHTAALIKQAVPGVKVAVDLSQATGLSLAQVADAIARIARGQA